MVPERELPYLETIVCAGEALPQRLVAGGAGPGHVQRVRTALPDD